MDFLSCRWAILSAILTVTTSPIDAGDPFHGVAVGNIQFTVLDGLHIDKVADDALIQWPIAATFDAEGDLLVLECHWNGESVQKQLVSKPHKIVRLSDTDGDGRFDERLVVAEELAFPEGIMVFGNDLLVTAPPNILKLSDADGDGFFEKQDVWFDGTTITHCANDLHGPKRGLDGWVYWTKGAFGEQSHLLLGSGESDDAERSKSKAAHIYRRHPSGGPIERLMTGGMDNPSDIAFSPEGERFFCSTFLHHPGNGIRDGIAHAPRGGLFGKQHQVLDGHWSTGPLLQPIAELGAAAPASIDFLKSLALVTAIPSQQAAMAIANPPRFLVTSQFNLHKVGLHRLVENGSSFETQSMDLVSADRVDFHPVDVLEESDGSLLIFDTGGWYDLCCPSSGSDQKIARGGIYRLTAASERRHNQARSINTPPALSPAEAMRIAMDRNQNVAARREALWQMAQAITLQDEPQLANATIALLSDTEPTIQQAAANIVGLNRWPLALPHLVANLKSNSPATVRSVIEAVGVIGNADSVLPILSAKRRFPDDRFISHSSIYALMEIGAIEPMINIAKRSLDDSEQLAVVHALDQMDQLPESLFPKLVSNLTSDREDLRSLAVRCLSKRETGIELTVPFLESAWNLEDNARLAACIPLVARGASHPKLRALFGDLLGAAPTQSETRQAWLIECLTHASSDVLPSEWSKPLVAWIRSANGPLLGRIADSIRKTKFANEDRASIARTLRSRFEELIAIDPILAVQVIAATPPDMEPLDEGSLHAIIQQITVPESSAVAEAALSRSRISPSSAKGLIAILKDLPPLRLQTGIDVLLRCRDDDVDRELTRRLPELPALKTLVVEKVLSSVNNRSDAMKGEWAAIMKSANRPPEDVLKELERWVERLPAGDAKRGYQVFSSPKAACSSCHQIGYVGGRLGPELSTIGRSRTRRDLVEAVVFPSIRMAQGYHPVRVRTVDDEVFNGLLTKQTDSYVELLCGVDKTCRIARSDVEEQSESKVSVMPSGLDQQMTLEEFADLLAFLESKR